MGKGLSTVQITHLRDLGDLVKAAKIISINHGKPLSSISQNDLVKLLKFIWRKYPTYPPSGDITSKKWKRILKYLNEPPKASYDLILTCQVIVDSLEIYEKAIKDSSDAMALNTATMSMNLASTKQKQANLYPVLQNSDNVSVLTAPMLPLHLQ